MALDNFSNLKASIQARSKKRDVSQSQLAEYIQQCEAEMYHNFQAPLRVREMEARATNTLSITDRFLPLPDRFLKMRSLRVLEPYTGGPDWDIQYLAPEQMPLNNDTQIPSYFTVTTQLEFDSISDDDYTVEMQYVRKLTALDDTNTTNDILTYYPNIYVFGSLWALFQDSREEELAEYYYGKFMTAINGANESTNQGRYGPAPYIRQEGYLP